MEKQVPPLLYNLDDDMGERNPLSPSLGIYKSVMASIDEIASQLNCFSTNSSCFNEFGGQVFASSDRCNPFPPNPFHPWQPKCNAEEEVESRTYKDEVYEGED